MARIICLSFIQDEDKEPEFIIKIKSEDLILFYALLVCWQTKDDIEKCWKNSTINNLKEILKQDKSFLF